MKFSYINANRGHAAILFVMIIPVLFGVFTLGSDGARALQDKARLNEAIEVASLAVSAQDSDDETVRKQTAKNFISYYFPQAAITDDDIVVTKTVCDPDTTTTGCDSTITDRYFDYHVTASITQDAWFPGDKTTVGFGKQYDVASASSSRKFQSEAIDVMLVADFSASMYDEWNGVRKFISVLDVISEIGDELEKYNQNLSITAPRSTIGLVGYDFYTKTEDGKFAANIYCSQHGNSSLDWAWSWSDGWYQYWDWSASYPSVDGRCDSHFPTEQNHNTLDVQKTISNVFVTSSAIHSLGWSSSEVVNISKFTNIKLTSNISSFKSIVNNRNIFNITANGGSGTSSFTGIIRGSQLLGEGNNSKRILIVLSDGGDSNVYEDPNATPPTGLRINNFSDQLYGNALYLGGLCSSIQQHFIDNDVDMTMAVIGFDYNITYYPQLANCVGDENVYTAANRTEIKNRILSLITEEIGRLAND